MTSAEFAKHENNRVQLATLLTSPVLRQALDALRGDLKPGLSNDGVLNPVVAAARYQQLAGINHVIDGLEKLTKAPKPDTRLAMKELLPEPPLHQI